MNNLTERVIAARRWITERGNRTAFDSIERTLLLIADDGLTDETDTYTLLRILNRLEPRMMEPEHV